MKQTSHVRLDSALRDPGGWALAPARAARVLRCDPATLITTLRSGDGEVEQRWDDPLEALAWMAGAISAGQRWVGFLGYDLGRLFETLPARATDDLGTPLFAFALVDESFPPQPPDADELSAPAKLVHADFTRAQYEAAVRRAIDYVAAGDVFQVNLSQRFTARCDASAASLYARISRQAPAWHGACLDFGDFALVSNSPELFLRVAPQSDGSRRVTTRPIKGTRPRAPGMDVALRDSPKDQAELNMIIDLERNDLGRVCEVGSVRVTQPRVIEAHPTVYHGAATVEGTLREDVGFVDLLRATFPGGSITGAPKIRAMEIIEELEPTRRGPYCGAIGYLAADGSMEFNVAIRTMIVRDGLVHISVGGGIVADSVPSEEYEETLVKARAMFAALGLDVADLKEWPAQE